jgi:4-hydroxysphinganine ceramide fatty acyl 2-hydroxylase
VSDCADHYLTILRLIFEMPLYTLPLVTREEVHARDSNGFCYMTLNTKVYDVTEFLSNHPGGADVIRRYAGHDIEQILKD